MRLKLNASISLLAAGMALNAAAVQAQDNEASADEAVGGNVIIVTAKQREQNLQEVALPISVFNEEALQERNILDPRDLALFTPGFSLASGAGRTDPTAVSIRGLAPNTSDERFQGVSFFVDGIALSGQLSGIDISQLERVEVIKGPQSAQFGRATYSGAVNFITKDPKVDDWELDARLRYSITDDAEEDNFQGSASVRFPIIHNVLWASANFNKRVMGSVANNVSLPSLPIGREETTSFGGVLYAEPSDNIDIKLRYSKDIDKDAPSLSHLIHPREFLGDSTFVTNAFGTFLVPNTLPDPVIGLDGGDPRPNSGPVDPEAGGIERTRELWSLIVGANFDNGMRLEYKGAFFESERFTSLSFAGRDAIGSTPGIGGCVTVDPVFAAAAAASEVTCSAGFNSFEFQERFENTSHQLLLLSPDDGALTWSLGGYYFDEESTNTRLPQTTPTNPQALNRGPETIENYAAFGSIGYDFTDQLNFQFEGRFQWETVAVKPCGGGTCQRDFTFGRTEKERDFLPRATLSYQVTPDNLLYALYSRGVKSGRISLSGFTPASFSISYAEPEELDNFEIGSKNTFFDGSVTLNAAFFHARVENQQLVSSNQGLNSQGEIVQVTTANNVGSSRIWGFEIEAAAQLTDELSVSGGIGVSDQEFVGKDPISGLSSALINTFPDENIVDPVARTVNLDGLQQANVPTTTGNFSVLYSTPVTDMVDFSLRTDVTYRGGFFADVANNTRAQEAWRVNMRATGDFENFSVSLFARNLLNDIQATSVGLGGSTSTCRFIEVDTATFGSGQRCYTTGIARPREVGVEFIGRF